MQNFAASAWLAGSIWLYWRSWRAIQGTTLESAWRWGCSAWLLWGIAWVGGLFPGLAPSGMLDQLWYAASLLVLAALISVLGAKRPGSRVWTWFVTVPMLLVLGWPALYAWFKGWPPQSPRLMPPALCAYAVVCVMGLGNYVGTRYLVSALSLGMALGLSVVPYSGTVSNLLPGPETCRFWSTVFAGFAVIWPAILAASGPPMAPWDRAWVDFVNSFGIVWGRRLQDRFNETARQAQWGVRLDLYGLTWDQPDGAVTPQGRSALPEWTPEMTNALQWLLRRFVDRTWLECRVGPLADTPKP